MRRTARFTGGFLTSILILAACQDQATSPSVIQERMQEDPSRPAPTLHPTEGYPEPGETRTGFILGRNGSPVQVTYEIHDGLAIWEGDIILGRVEEIATTADQLRRPAGISYGVVIDGAGFRWPNGVVPYVINSGLTNTSRVTDAIAMVEQSTPGITLVPRSGESDYVEFTPGSGCSSAIGRQGGMQEIILGDNCTTGNTAHEILHALGMYHEHTRCDRDNFVLINTANIEDGRAHNFDKSCDGASDIDVYDAGSIMHYGPFAFSRNGEKTIEAIPESGIDEADMGQRLALGPTDVSTMNALYGANNAAPIAVIGSLAAGYPEGSAVSFDGTGSSDADDAESILTYAWDFGDGNTGTGANPSHTYSDNGSYTVTLTVSDGFASSTPVSRSVTITNVAPTVNAGLDQSVDEGSTLSGSGSFTDPGADSWTATVDYGDGAGVQPLPLIGKTFSLSHVYVDGNASHTVTVTVTDEDGGAGLDAVIIAVNNVAPDVEAGANTTLTSGEVLNFAGSFTDPGLNDAPWTYEINWGFGSNTTGSTNDQSQPIQASRQVCAAGSYQVTLSVTDKDTDTGSDSRTLTVNYYAVGVDVTPRQTPNPVSLNNRGVLPVAILSTPLFDATGVDPSTVTVGDGAGTDTPVAQRNNGTYRTSIEDANRDGLLDLVVMVENPALVANGDVVAASTQLVVRGFLNDTCTNFGGTDAIQVVS